MDLLGWLGFLIVCVILGLGWLCYRYFAGHQALRNGRTTQGTDNKTPMESIVREAPILESVPQQPSSLFCEINQKKIHYIQMGRGPHLVLIHGIAASLYIWRFIMPELSKKFTVTALDLPGFGGSSKYTHHGYGLDDQAESVIEFLNCLGIEQAQLVGSSMGGAIALWMAKRHPERFSQVAAISPATNPRLIQKEFLPILPLLTPIVPVAKRIKYLANHHTARLIYSRVVSKPELVNPEAIQMYLRPYLNDRDSITTLFKATQLLTDRRLPGELKDIRSEVLVLWGAQDRLVPKKYMEELKEHLPNHIFYAHPRAGHHSMEDEPDWVAQHLLQFFIGNRS